MQEDVKRALLSRFKSLLWRAGAMLAALLINFMLDNIGLIGLNPIFVTIIGLGLGEVSKWINSSLPALRAARAGKSKNK